MFEKAFRWICPPLKFADDVSILRTDVAEGPSEGETSVNG